MAVRRPIVLVNGRSKELPVGDTLPDVEAKVGSDGTVSNIVKITQAAYDALSPPVETTLYVIVG